MIQVTRLNHLPLILNSDLIEHIEATPDTVVSLTTGQKIMVLESAEEIVERVVQFRRTIHPMIDFSSISDSPSHNKV
jgi:flagellar protein FlbD